MTNSLNKTTTSYMSNLKCQYDKLQRKVTDLQRENSIMKAQLKHGSNDFFEKILLFVEGLCLNSKYSDVIFRLPESLIPGHKFVLESRGGSWNSYNENGVEYVDIKGANQNVCEEFIAWIYKGVLKSEYNSLISLMILAHDHCLSALLTQCETMLTSFVSRKNCIPLCSAAFDAGASNLFDHCSTYLTSFWSEASNEEVGTLSVPVLKSILEKHSRFPTHCAIKLGRDDTALSIIETDPSKSMILVNELDENEFTPLYLALSKNRIDLAEKLLLLGADPDQLIGLDDTKQPMLLYAFLNKQYELVQFLLNHGCKFDTPSLINAQTLLHLISINGCDTENGKVITQLTETLLLSGADSSLQNINGNTALHLSILHHNTDVFALLMKYTPKSHLNVTNQQGICPLWLAIVTEFSSNNSSELDVYGFSKGDPTRLLSYNYTAQLISAGANINFRFDVLNWNQLVDLDVKLPLTGDTLLLSAARTGREAAALFLLKNPECDPVLESSSVEGETVLHVAIESKLVSLCKYLITQCEIDINRVRSIPPVRKNNQQSAPLAKSKIVTPFDDDVDDDDDDVNEYLSNKSDDLFSSSSINTSINAKFTSVNNYLSNLALCDFNTKLTPLHSAVRHQLFELVNLYFNRNGCRSIDWFVRDGQDETVLHLLLWSEKFDIVDRILDHLERDLPSTNHTASLIHPCVNPDDSTLNRSMLMDYLNRQMHSIYKSSLLIQTIERGKLEAVQFLINRGADPNERLINQAVDDTASTPDSTKSSICPLWTALNYQQWDIADYLVSRGADVNSWLTFEETNVEINLLHRSIHNNNEKAAILLVNRSCDVNSCPRLINPSLGCGDQTRLQFLMPHLSFSPLHMAILMKMPELTSCLIKCNSTDINQQDFDGQTPLHLAVYKKQLTIVQSLLSSPKINCSLRDAQGHSVFHVATIIRDHCIAQLLLNKDRSLALQVDNMGRNFLHTAIQNMDREAVFFLIQIAVDMNACVRDANRLTPFHLAIQVGVDEDILRSLLLAGASMTAQTPRKHSGLHLAVIHDRPKLIQCLLDSGADVNVQDAERNTPLHLAIRYGKIESFMALLAYPDTNRCSTNIRGQLPIHTLAQQHNSVVLNMFEHLIDDNSSANQINAQDAAGNTPLLLAYLNENVPLCIALLHAGASFGISNTEGDNVFSLNKKKMKSSVCGAILAKLLDSLVEEPHWEEGTACVECGTKFGITNRKHHCRHCGRVLCSQCSSLEVPILKFDLCKPVRVCETCFSFLNDPIMSILHVHV